MFRLIVFATFVCALTSNGSIVYAQSADVEPYPGTEPLMMEGDIASELVSGVDRFLLRKLAASIEQRPQYWQRDFASSEKYVASVQTNRER